MSTKVEGQQSIQPYIRDEKMIDIKAHDTEVVQMALSLSGLLLATASQRGTLIRTFDTVKGEQLQELRRGSNPCTIQFISFDKEARSLCVCSDKPKIHIFHLKSEEKAESQNTKSYFSMMSSVISVAGSEGSAMQFEIDAEDSQAGFKAVLFNGGLHVVTRNRKYYRAGLQNSGLLKRDEENELTL